MNTGKASAADGEDVRREDSTSVESRVDGLPWTVLQQSLAESGFAVTPKILTPEECVHLRNLYSQEQLFRSRVIMERLRFGRGDYKYFANPLPEIVSELRTHSYPHLAEVANRLAEELGESERFPPKH